MYCRKSGWSAKQQGTGNHAASWNHSVIMGAVLLWDWTYPVIEVRIKGLTFVKDNNTDLKSRIE